MVPMTPLLMSTKKETFLTIANVDLGHLGALLPSAAPRSKFWTHTLAELSHQHNHHQ